MNPTEKAKELIHKALPFVESYSSLQQVNNAKQCALIMVDEIMGENESNKINNNYWYEVMIAIDKL